MASANKNTVGSLDIGTFLKIVSTNGVNTNLPKASALWDFMQKIKVGNPEGREQRWNIVADRGQDAAQFLPAGDEGAFPAVSRTVPQEASGYFKEFGATIQVPRHLLSKQGSALAAYADSFGYEVEQKLVAVARLLSRSLCGDGTGALGKIASAAISNGDVVITLSSTNDDAGQSHVNWAQIGEKVVIYDNTGATFQTNTNSSGTTTYYKVVSRDRAANTITLQPYSSADAALTATAVNAIGSGDFLYPYGSGSNDHINDLSSIGTDYNRLSYAFTGLESLAADDGRTVHGLTMSGALAGTRTNASGDTIDRSHFQSALSYVKEITAGNDFKYDTAFMYTLTYDALIDSWETDRVVQSASDTVMGAGSDLVFKHGRDSVKIVPEEFVQKNRIWMLPKGDVLQYVGTGIDRVSVGGSTEFMPTNTSTGTHQRAVNAYLEGSGMLRTTYPAAIAVIENFAI